MRASAVQAAALPGEVVSNAGKQKDCKKSLDIRSHGGRSQCSVESQCLRNQNERPLFLWYQDLKSARVVCALIWPILPRSKGGKT